MTKKSVEYLLKVCSLSNLIWGKVLIFILRFFFFFTKFDKFLNRGLIDGKKIKLRDVDYAFVSTNAKYQANKVYNAMNPDRSLVRY